MSFSRKTSFFAIFRRFNGHKAVESGDNQFVFRVGPDEYCPFPLRHVRYMAVRPLAQPPTALHQRRPDLAAGGAGDQGKPGERRAAGHGDAGCRPAACGGGGDVV